MPKRSHSMTSSGASRQAEPRKWAYQAFPWPGFFERNDQPSNLVWLSRRRRWSEAAGNGCLAETACRSLTDIYVDGDCVVRCGDIYRVAARPSTYCFFFGVSNGSRPNPAHQAPRTEPVPWFGDTADAGEAGLQSTSRARLRMRHRRYPSGIPLCLKKNSSRVVSLLPNMDPAK